MAAKKKAVTHSLSLASSGATNQHTKAEREKRERERENPGVGRKEWSEGPSRALRHQPGTLRHPSFIPPCFFLGFFGLLPSLEKKKETAHRLTDSQTGVAPLLHRTDSDRVGEQEEATVYISAVCMKGVNHFGCFYFIFIIFFWNRSFLRVCFL